MTIGNLNTGTAGVVHSSTAGVLSSSLIVNADVSASAAIAFSKLAALPLTDILVGNGSNVATAVAVTGDATLSNAGALTLATLSPAVPAGSYGSATSVGTFTVNGKGLVTAASSTAIAGLAPGAISLTNDYMIVGNGSNVGAAVQMSGDATIATGGALTLATLSPAVPAGSYGSATSVGTFTVNGKGLVTAASSTAIAGLAPGAISLTNDYMIVGNGSNVGAAVQMSGDATIATGGALTLATLSPAVPAGSYGSATSVGTFTGERERIGHGGEQHGNSGIGAGRDQPDE